MENEINTTLNDDVSNSIFTSKKDEIGYQKCSFRDSYLLKEIYKNVNMAVKSIEALIKQMPKSDLKELISAQYDCYVSLKDEVSKNIESIKEPINDINFFSKAMLFSSIKVKTLVDDSMSHIADMLIKGTNMGIITLTKALHEYQEISSEECVRIANETLNMQSKFVESIKEFL